MIRVTKASVGNGDQFNNKMKAAGLPANYGKSLCVAKETEMAENNHMSDHLYEINALIEFDLMCLSVGRSMTVRMSMRQTCLRDLNPRYQFNFMLSIAESIHLSS